MGITDLPNAPCLPWLSGFFLLVTLSSELSESFLHPPVSSFKSSSFFALSRLLLPSAASQLPGI